MRRSLTIAIAGFAAAMLSACDGPGAGEPGNGTSATIQVECSGNQDAAVAIRWSHPKYDSPDPYMPLWSVPCSSGTATKQLTVSHVASQFEIQTEGGSLTGYSVSVTVNGKDGSPNNNITLTHSGVGEPLVRGTGFGISRSAGPNEYGEQNFRVTIPQGSVANVKVAAESFGDRSDAQMALRWGHPDFHDNEYFPLWTIKPGGRQEKQFRLADQNSEFEIQTEGGINTAYNFSIWFDFGNGFGNQASIEINHKRSISTVSKSVTDVTFEAGEANHTGERNVDVNAPWIEEAGPCAGGPRAQEFLLFRQPSGIYYAESPSLGTAVCINRAISFTIDPSPYRIMFIPTTPGTDLECSAATVSLGPTGQKVATTSDDMTALFGSANPELPLRLAACVETGDTLLQFPVRLTYQPSNP